MKRKLLYVLMAAFIIASFPACREMEELKKLEPQKTVHHDNIFTSTYPKFKLRIDPDLEYAGKAKSDNKTTAKEGWRVDALENVYESVSYLFAATDVTGILKRGAVIRMHTTMGSPDQKLPELFPDTLSSLESGSVRIFDEQYDQKLLASASFFLPHETELLHDYALPQCFLVKGLERLAGFGNKAKIQIIYFEALDTPCGEWTHKGALSEDQQAQLQAFTDRSFSSLRFFRDDYDVADYTRKYSDQPVYQYQPPYQQYQQETPGYQYPPQYQQPAAPPAGMAPAAGAAGSVTNLERKLEVLKGLLDKGLITGEEYNRKKAQLLDNF